MENNNGNGNMNGYYENMQGRTDTAAQPEAHNADSENKRVYTTAQKALLLPAAALAVFFACKLWPEMFAGETTINTFGLWYSIFWGGYLALYYAFMWKHMSHRIETTVIAAVAVFLMLRYAIYQENILNLINIVAIPMLLMLHAVVGAVDAPKGLEGQYLLQYVRGWFVAPFSAIGRWFGAVGSLFKRNGDDKKRGKALLGLLIGIPLLVAVLALLFSADSVMGWYFGRLFYEIEIGTVIWRLILIFAACLLLYSFIYNMVWGKKTVRTEPVKRSVEPVTVIIIISLLLAAYLLFAVFQFVYLTGLAGLPEGMTYSDYAVRGFGELCAVAAINFALYAVTLSFTKEHKAIRPLLLSLMLANCVILYSAIMRLSMYISAYALTIARVLPMWFMIFLAALTLVCIARLYAKRFRLFYAAVAMFVIWYAALCCVNTEAMIAKSILVRGEERGGLTAEDENYLDQLSPDANEALEDFRPQT